MIRIFIQISELAMNLQIRISGSIRRLGYLFVD